jgi:hypothetical protein
LRIALTPADLFFLSAAICVICGKKLFTLDRH